MRQKGTDGISWLVVVMLPQRKLCAIPFVPFLTERQILVSEASEATTEDLAELNKAIKVLSKFFNHVVVYTPDEEVIAMHWAISEEVLIKSCREFVEEEVDDA